MQYSEPKILLLLTAIEPLMASPDDGGSTGSGWNGEMELPPVPVGRQ